MSQDVFQMRMDQITDRLPGVIAIHDDICIYGKTQQQHDKHLLQLLKTASKNGLVFNSRKCHISTWDEARSHYNTGITRPSYTSESKTTAVFPGISQLLTTIPSRYCYQRPLFLGNKFHNRIGHPQQIVHFNN